MPDEYISREAALMKLMQDGCSAKNLQSISDMPAADVAPVYYAHWEEADWREYDAQSCETIRYLKAAIVCSECRNAFKKGSLRIQSFCPACGAKMVGEPE